MTAQQKNLKLNTQTTLICISLISYNDRRRALGLLADTHLNDTEQTKNGSCSHYRKGQHTVMGIASYLLGIISANSCGSA